MLEEKSSCLCRGSNLDRPVVQSVARHYTDWATLAHMIYWLSEKIAVSIFGFGRTGCHAFSSWP
jgi:hypothetical protein